MREARQYGVMNTKGRKYFRRRKKSTLTNATKKRSRKMKTVYQQMEVIGDF